MEMSSKPHVVIVSSPGVGHVTPCLELAKCLVSHHGVEVTFFVTSVLSSLHQTKMLESLVLPQDLHLINLPPVDTSKVVSLNTDVATCFTIIVKESIPVIRSTILKSLRTPTIFITDLFSSYAFEIADDLKMSKYVFSTVNALNFASLCYSPKLVGKEAGEFLEIPGCRPIRFKDLDHITLDFDNPSFYCMMGHVGNMVKTSGILVNTFEDLELDTLKGFCNESILQQIGMPPVYAVGPIIQSDISSSKADYFRWLDKQPGGSVLLVALGSSAAMSAEQVTELAWGLELSKQRFIWVVRPPQQFTLASYVAAGGNQHSTDPSTYLPEGFLKRTQGIGLVVPDWAPQLEILGHDSIGAFLSHCGWNSSLESVTHGVPMIALPLYAEQGCNALMLAEDIGVAVRLAKGSDKGVICREKIASMVRLVMVEEEGNALKNRARELKCSAKAAMEKGGSSYNSLAELVETWKGHKLFIE